MPTSEGLAGGFLRGWGCGGRECVREKDELPERLGYSGYFRWLGLNATDDAGPWR